MGVAYIYHIITVWGACGGHVGGQGGGGGGGEFLGKHFPSSSSARTVLLPILSQTINFQDCDLESGLSLCEQEEEVEGRGRGCLIHTHL